MGLDARHPSIAAALRAQLPLAVGPAPRVPVPESLPPGISEREFTKEVVDLARNHGWLVFHPIPLRTKRGWATGTQGDVGWPDLCLVRPPENVGDDPGDGGTVIFAELKVGKNTTTPAQDAWLRALRSTGAAAGIWTPDSWPEIVRTLTGSDP